MLIQQAVERGHTDFMSGMALGVDTWAAEEVLKHGMKLHAAVPFLTQDARWPTTDRQKWRNLLENAHTRYCVSEKTEYDTYQELQEAIEAASEYTYREICGWLHARNAYMVDNSDILLAIWNGDDEGGTARCIKYALKKDHKILMYNPVSESTRWLNR